MTRFSSAISVALRPGWVAMDSITLTAPDGLANVIVSTIRSRRRRPRSPTPRRKAPRWRPGSQSTRSFPLPAAPRSLGARFDRRALS